MVIDHTTMYDLALLVTATVSLLYGAVHFSQKRKNAEEEAYYIKACGYLWKVRTKTGELADWSVYCPECTTRLVDTNSHFFCPACQKRYDQSYYGIIYTAFRVEKETRRFARRNDPTGTMREIA